ncbi:sulfurtransferase [Actinokineospora bangkokensis]|uniref:Sulfurtransferase n=1 Tax=Actinokineospora bangkokensis TaxID=1193682 RepID=A0A1Q9LMG1_9PSEU|nr:sulfurtransferase [Actinokineospora bangkokensis]OLR93218.1 sulfurtransferase [Actinokineospora bangkokensis]
MTGPLVDADWLGAHLDEVVVVDVRWYLDGRSGRAAHESGHLPGAVWADVDTDLSAPPTPGGGRHPLPTPEGFADRLGRLGIADDAVVVAYDDSGGAYAARLVWLLRLLGQRAHLLDGGIQAWPGELETGATTREPVTRTAVEWPAGAFRTADTVRDSEVLLDARAHDRYTGQNVLPSDVRSGHIPGARSAFWGDNLNGDGTLAPVERLRAHYAALGVVPGADVAVYCGSGVTACHDLLALERIGVRASLYPGSWSAWSADTTRPIATGDGHSEEEQARA